jgi:hypothetical protein
VTLVADHGTFVSSGESAETDGDLAFEALIVRVRRHQGPDDDNDE